MRIRPLTVVRNKGSKTSAWRVNGLKEEGKRVRRFFPTERAALAFIRQAEPIRQREGEAAVLVPLHVRIEAGICSEKLKPFGKTLTQAVDHYLDHLEAMAGSIPIPELVERYIAGIRALRRSKGHIGDLRTRLGKFAEAFPDKLAAQVSIHDIEGWLEELDHFAPQTINHYRDKVFSLFEYAVAREYCRTNPAAKVPKLSVVRGAPRIVSVNELRALLSAATDEMLPFIAIGAFAGLRSTEIQRLDWRSVDLPQRVIRLAAEHTKTKRRRIVTISENLAQWLAPYVRAEGKVLRYEFRHSYVELNKIAIEAGMNGWPRNALRHSFCSYHSAKWQNPNATAVQSGHDVKTMWEHYHEVVLPADADAYWQIVPLPVAAALVQNPGDGLPQVSIE